MAVKPHVTVDARETPEQRRGPEPDERCSSPSATLYLCLCHLSLSHLFHSASLIVFQISRVSFLRSLSLSFSLSLCLSHFSRPLYSDPRVTAAERMSYAGQGNIVVIL